MLSANFSLIFTLDPSYSNLHFKMVFSNKQTTKSRHIKYTKITIQPILVNSIPLFMT